MKNVLLFLLIIPIGCANSSPQEREQTQAQSDTPESYSQEPGVVELREAEAAVSNACLEAIQNIMTSSAAYQKYLAQSEELEFTLGFRLEHSPNPLEDQAAYEEASDYYVFAIHESTPDHNSTLTRLAFDSAKQVLYEDLIGDGTYNTEVEFDRALLAAFEANCR